MKSFLLHASRLLTSHFTYKINNGLAKGMRRKGGLGFMPQVGPLTTEQRFLQSLDMEGKIVFDIGGYEGFFTLFFA